MHCANSCFSEENREWQNARISEFLAEKSKIIQKIFLHFLNN